jgi:hypothetical protein
MKYNGIQPPLAHGVYEMILQLLFCKERDLDIPSSSETSKFRNTFYSLYTSKFKGKAIPLQPWTGP